jgi:hypothetical protein
MNYQEALKIRDIPASLVLNWNQRSQALAFLEGWDARMDFEAERNGKPMEPEK